MTLLFTFSVNAYGGGGNGGYQGNGGNGGGGNFGGSEGGNNGGYGNGNGMGGGYSSGENNYGNGNGNSLAVMSSQRPVQYRDIQVPRSYAKPTSVYVDSQAAPLNLVFRSTSSDVNIDSQHSGGQGSFQSSQSTDKPHIRVMTVTKPSEYLIFF